MLCSMYQRMLLICGIGIIQYVALYMLMGVRARDAWITKLQSFISFEILDNLIASNQDSIFVFHRQAALGNKSLNDVSPLPAYC